MPFDVERAIVRAERVATRATLSLLVARLGPWATARVGARLARLRLARFPFAALGPPVDERDRLSRRQAAPVVQLDRALAGLVSPEVSLELVRAALVAGAVPFLDAMVPPLAPERLAAEAGELMARFFNAEGTAAPDGPAAFRFDVHRCRFVELLDAVGASHLAPLFCESDLVFFDGVRRPVVLGRTRTLGTGGAGCDFRFTPK